jgi:hypothetical protein
MWLALSSSSMVVVVMLPASKGETNRRSFINFAACLKRWVQKALGLLDCKEHCRWEWRSRGFRAPIAALLAAGRHPTPFERIVCTWEATRSRPIRKLHFLDYVADLCSQSSEGRVRLSDPRLLTIHRWWWYIALDVCSTVNMLTHAMLANHKPMTDALLMRAKAHIDIARFTSAPLVASLLKAEAK